MLITPAFAQSSGGLAEGGFGLLPIIFVMIIFYFLLGVAREPICQFQRQIPAG